MTVYFVIWGIIGCLITNIVTADDDGYNIWYIIVSIIFGWLIGTIVLLFYLGQLLPKLVKPMFVSISKWLLRWIE